MINKLNDRRRPNTKLKHIIVSELAYFALKRLGGAGDSFNDVVIGLLNKKGLLESESSVPTKASISKDEVNNDN